MSGEHHEGTDEEEGTTSNSVNEEKTTTEGKGVSAEIVDSSGGLRDLREGSSDVTGAVQGGRRKKSELYEITRKVRKINSRKDELSKVRVRDTGSGEEFGTVREEEVDTSPLRNAENGSVLRPQPSKPVKTYLLTHLDKDTVHGTEKHAILGLEAVSETGRLRKLVLFDSGDDLIHFALYLGLIRLVSTKFGEVDLGLFDVSALNVESRRFRSENGSEENGTSEDELNGNGESP